MDELLNNQSTTSSTTSGWFGSLVNAAANTGAAYLNRNKTAAAGQPAPTTTATNFSPFLIIGGAVVLVLVLVLALKK